MRSHARIASVAALLIAASLGQPAASSATPAGCAEGSVQAAARRLVHPDAEVLDRTTVAGFESALVYEPLIYPGVRHRLIRAGDAWCEGSAISEAWRLDGRRADDAALARAAAQLLGIANFDGVRVTGQTAVMPGVHTLETHALTNGITARWTILTDDQGVRTARWISTGFAVEPFEGEWEGLSALPGVVRTYVRGAGGALAQVEPVLPETPAVPETVTEGETEDGFIIRVNVGGSGFSPNAGENTGVHDVDFIRRVRDTALENYSDAYDWGFRKNWDSNIGNIFIDNTTAASCFACVQRSGTFNVHMSSRIEQILLALGWEYPDSRDGLSTVLGHEMVHDWQNAYGKPSFSQRESAFSEGTARMLEAAHDYSPVSFQTDSLIYSTGRDIPGVSLAANSCNGWDGGNITSAFAQGPFTGKSYNACYFWLTWYGTHGPTAFVDFFDAMRTHQTKPGSWSENRGGIEEVTGGSILPDLVRFASAALTDHGYTWADHKDRIEPIDWSTYLDRWSVAVMAPGGSASASLRDGGVMAREIEVGGYPSLSSSQPAAAIAQVRSTDAGATFEILAPGDCIEPPAEGERIWLVGAYPESGTASVTIGHTALDPGLTECPKDPEEG